MQTYKKGKKQSSRREMLYKTFCPRCGTDVFSCEPEESICSICKQPFLDERNALRERIVVLEKELELSRSIVALLSEEKHAREEKAKTEKSK